MDRNAPSKMKDKSEKIRLKHHPKRLKIAMLSIHSSPVGDLGTQDTGGMSVYIMETAKELAGKGHHIDIFTQYSAGRYEPVMQLFDNVRLICLSGGTRGNIAKSALYKVLPRLFNELESFRIKENIVYDVLHSHYWISGVLGHKLRSFWNVHHLITYHTIGAVKNLTCSTENVPELRLASEKKLTKQCDRIIVPTQKDKEYLRQYYDAPCENIRIVPCGVNFNRFKPQDKIFARKKLALPVDAPIILYVGRFAPIKGLDRLFESFRRIKHPSRAVLVMVGGDGEGSFMWQHLTEKAKALQIQNRLIFAGRVDQKILPLYYSAADVLAVPSYYESFGLCALEALACGTSVVATSVGAMEKIVQDNVTGYVSTDSDPQYFSNLIEAALAKQRQNGLLPSKIRASVSEFTWTRTASLLLDAYRSVLADKS